MLVCPGCERPNGLAARFCLYCGFRFKADPAPDGSFRAEPEEKLAERMVCDGCSAPLTENRREQSFRCIYCGTLYRNRHGAPPVVIFQSESDSGNFESHSDAAEIVGSILGGVLDGGRRSRRGWGWSWNRGGDGGCMMALLMIPFHAIARALFRSRGW